MTTIGRSVRARSRSTCSQDIAADISIDRTLPSPARPRMFSQRIPAGRSWKPFRSLRSLAPSTGESTVTTRAAAPARAARSARASVTSIRGWMYSWNQTSGAMSPAAVARRGDHVLDGDGRRHAGDQDRVGGRGGAGGRPLALGCHELVEGGRRQHHRHARTAVQQGGLRAGASRCRAASAAAAASRAKPASFARRVISSRAPPDDIVEVDRIQFFAGRILEVTYSN